MTKTLDVALVVDQQCDVGEGPLWDPRAGLLYWVDITPGRLYSWHPRMGVRTVIEAEQTLGSVALQAGGGLVLALRDGLHVLTPEGAIDVLLRVDADSPSHSLNDSGCDRAGRLWVGRVADDESPESGCLYRISPDLGIARAVDRTTLANGVGWSPDDRTMYFADSTTLTVFAFDYDLQTGTATSRREFVRTEPADGLPDGLTVDEEGFVWVAYWGGWCVRRFSPDGRLDRVVEVPVAQVSSCTFGGERLDELYITTAAFQLTGAERSEQPAAGSLFRARPGVRGLPPNPFGGCRPW
jgi:sugar lactone lactonase YvrE